ncbi:MAG: heme exporter protein CcmB [Armatimonas sp.]
MQVGSKRVHWYYWLPTMRGKSLWETGFWKSMWLREAVAVFLKECRTEWRTRVALSGVGLFLLGGLVLIGLAFQGRKVDIDAASALLWVLLLFTAATGLGRGFVQETERGTALALRLHARASAVWVGKFAFNATLLLALAAMAAPLLLGALAVDTSKANYAALACVLGLGSIGVAAVFTTTSALVAQSSSRGGALLAALSFPVLVPALFTGVGGTKAALGVSLTVSAWEAASGYVTLLGSYGAIAIAISLLLFDYVWND